MTPHAFEPDTLGDCQHCPLPKDHPTHVQPPTETYKSPDGKRAFNLLSKAEGMELAATSRASEEFRRTFFLAMAEVATRQQYVTTNDAWDLLESRGYRRSGSAQATGTIGPSGVSIGLWERTEQKALNTSGNLHSTDDGVRVYQSKIVGKDFETEVVPIVVEKARALAAKAIEREQAKAEEAYRAVIPEGAEQREEHRIWDDESEKWKPVSPTAVTHARLRGYRMQVRVVIETPWVDLE